MLASRPVNGASETDPVDELNDEDDEETLQLKLQAIQARIKLKKLQAAKAQKTAGESYETGSEAPSTAGGGLREVPLQSRLAAARERMERQTTQNSIQVPASPVKKAQARPDVQTSPQRIVLGIDKGRRAADVSLKRAPSQRKLRDDGQPGGYLRRSKTPNPGQAPESSAPRPLSFNERLASARTEEVSRQERQAKIQSLRSTAFSVGRQEMEQYKSEAVDMPDLPTKPEEFSREEILATTDRQRGGGLKRSNTVPRLRSTAQRDYASEMEDQQGAPSASARAQTKKKVEPADVPDSEASAFEPYSGLHLSKRIIPHQVLARAISGKKSYTLKDLLRHVKAPDWSLPDVEQDVVMLAIIASKSDPRSHKPGPGGAGKQQQDRGKYMVMTLVDLKFEVELFLFNSGFDRFWKLTPGTIVAVLNPVIMPPPPGREATGRFSLVINSGDDTILEIGTARDLGYCKSIKRDGQPCKSWINSKRTEYCEFHTNEAVRKVRNNRVELNSMSFGGDGPTRKFNSRYVHQKREQPEEVRRLGNYDRETQSRWFMSGGGRGAGILDDEREGGFADRAERAEGLKRRLAQKERERDIAKKLGEIGGGAGREYMSRAATTTATTDGALGSSISSYTSAAVSGAASSSQNTSVSTLPGEKPKRLDARSLGLVAPRGEQPKIDLGAVKRKRPESSQSSSTANGNSVGGKLALGWGSELKSKLSRMKEGERLDGAKLPSKDGADITNYLEPRPTARADGSPVRKKTRFVTEKGIREAGRESLGEPLSLATRGRQVVLDDDDDDDLIIVK